MWGICLRSYEKESLLKSFLLFFSVQFIFLSIVIYQDYNKVIHEYDMYVGNKMMQCHLDKECNKFQLNPVQNIGDKRMYTLYVDSDVYMFFKTKDSYTKMYTSKENYLNKHFEIQKYALVEYSLYLLALMLESIFFALYAIRPLKKALELNEEFVKDILHDFNTPLSALKINHKILTKQYGENDAIQRSAEALDNVLFLQADLHYFINQSELKNDSINLKNTLQQRMKYFQTIFSDVTYSLDLKEVTLYTNRDAFLRVIDNLLSNAGKYNIKNGTVEISLNNSTLTIKDSGIGIKNPDKIFDRYYKENDRGIGIGLHIVQKLCTELGINLSLTTELTQGSTFSLDLHKIITRR